MFLFMSATNISRVCEGQHLPKLTSHYAVFHLFLAIKKTCCSIATVDNPALAIIGTIAALLQTSL
jgi:hypothetical protein